MAKILHNYGAQILIKQRYLPFRSADFLGLIRPGETTSRKFPVNPTMVR